MFGIGKQRSSTTGTSSIVKNRYSSVGGGPSSAGGKTGSIGGGIGSMNANISPGSPEASTPIPYIKIADNSKLLPKYSMALMKSSDDTVQPDDLDAVQLELESLLSTVALRYRVLKTEFDALQSSDDRRERDRKSKYAMDRQPMSPGGKKKRYDEKTMKSSKDGKGGASGQGKFSSNKMKNSNMPSPAPSQQTDDSMDGSIHGGSSNLKDNPKLLLPKNDAPSRFWLSVEPYCMQITQEDVKLLDDLIEDYSGQMIPPIPELGPHYSHKWATDDLKDEQDSSNPHVKPRSKNFTSQPQGEVNGMVKNAEKLMGENITGPLTQRLVSALMEENLLGDGDLQNSENGTNTENMSNNRGGGQSSSSSVMKNGISIERRVKKELIEQGLLDPDDFKPGQDDEILSDIKRVRTELTAIADYNVNELKRLRAAAKEEIKRLEVKRELDSIDQEVRIQNFGVLLFLVFDIILLSVQDN